LKTPGFFVRHLLDSSNISKRLATVLHATVRT